MVKLIIAGRSQAHGRYADDEAHDDQDGLLLHLVSRFAQTTGDLLLAVLLKCPPFV